MTATACFLLATPSRLTSDNARRTREERFASAYDTTASPAQHIAMTNSDAYEALAGRLGFPGSALLRSILESLMTPEQAALVEALPGTVQEVAEKAGVSEAEARRQLDALYYAGVVFPRGAFDKRDYYRFARHIIQLHDATLGSQHMDVEKGRAFFEKWQAFCTEEMFARLGAMFRIVPTRISRIIPARKALAGLPDVPPLRGLPRDPEGADPHRRRSLRLSNANNRRRRALRPHP